MLPAASLAALAAILAYAASAWGWGRALLRACRLEEASGAAYPAILGLAALAALGGWLNLLRLAYPPLLWLLLAAGWILAALALRRLPRAQARLANRGALMAAVVIALAAEFLALTLLPSASFNTVDDFQLYFARPVRMLQAGTLGGNVFDPIGLDTLGTHAFLQAFTLLALPLQFLNAFDAVLCLLLAMALVASLGERLGIGALATLAALAAVLLVPPLQVNVSPVYALAMFCLALAPAAARLEPAQAASGAWPRTLPLGLLVAAAAGAKTTALAFLAPAAAAYLAGFGLWRGWRAAGGHALRIAAWASLFLLPWLALHAGKYAAWISGARGGGGFGLVGSPAEFLTASKYLGWGGTVMQFNALAAFALLAALAGAIVLARADRAALRGRGLPLVALCAGAALAYLLNAFPYDVNHAVRYSVPALIAGTAAGALLAALLAPRIVAPALAVALASGAGALFADTTEQRLERALVHNTAFSYPAAGLPGFAMLTAWGLSPEVQAWMRRAQSVTEPGERILALIACPYHLLFARNPVLLASEFGLSSPWLELPADAAALREFLARHRVRYVLWQVGALAKSDAQLEAQASGPYPVERRLARNLLSFRGALADLTRAAGAIYADEGLIVVDLKRPEPARR